MSKNENPKKLSTKKTKKQKNKKKKKTKKRKKQKKEKNKKNKKKKKTKFLNLKINFLFNNICFMSIFYFQRTVQPMSVPQ